MTRRPVQLDIESVTTVVVDLEDDETAEDLLATLVEEYQGPAGFVADYVPQLRVIVTDRGVASSVVLGEEP